MFTATTIRWSPRNIASSTGRVRFLQHDAVARVLRAAWVNDKNVALRTRGSREQPATGDFQSDALDMASVALIQVEPQIAREDMTAVAFHASDAKVTIFRTRRNETAANRATAATAPAIYAAVHRPNTVFMPGPRP